MFIVRRKEENREMARDCMALEIKKDGRYHSAEEGEGARENAMSYSKENYALERHVL